jgi:hypothetical protein
MLDHSVNWYDLDDQQQWALIHQRLHQLTAFSAGGALKQDPDDTGKVHFSGKYLERSFRVTVDKDTQSFELLAKVDNRSEVLDILDAIYLDKDKQPQAAQPADEWADNDDVVFFLAPGVFLQDSAERVEANKATLARFGAGLPQLLSQFVFATEGGISVSDDRVELRFGKNIAEVVNFGGMIQGSLDFLAQLFRGFGV